MRAHRPAPLRLMRATIQHAAVGEMEAPAERRKRATADAQLTADVVPTETELDASSSRFNPTTQQMFCARVEIVLIEKRRPRATGKCRRTAFPFQRLKQEKDYQGLAKSIVLQFF